jgi:TonB family protein
MLRRWRFLLLLVVSCGSICLGQTPLKPLQTFSPPEGHFSISLPGVPQEDTILTRMTGVPVHTFVLSGEAATYVIVYADVTFGPANTEESKKMLDGRRDQMFSRYPGLKLLSEKDIKLGEYVGREMISCNDVSVLRTRTYIVGRRIYEIMFDMPRKLALKKPDQIETRTDQFESSSEQFLNSFTVSEAAEQIGEVDRLRRELAKKRVVTLIGTADQSSENLITQGVVNGKAVHLETPAYPAIARSAHASGKVSVAVIIDFDGSVAAAQVVDGHPLLRAAAIKAARESKFTPTLLEGKPVMVLGVIIYNFVAQ